MGSWPDLIPAKIVAPVATRVSGFKSSLIFVLGNLSLSMRFNLGIREEPPTKMISVIVSGYVLLISMAS